MPPAADRSSARAPLTRAEAEVLRIICDARHPVFVTVHTNGRRRYSYWRPLDSGTGRGGCYVALPTAECDRLQAAGRISLGEPVTDPTRTTYRVRPVRVTPAAARIPAAPRLRVVRDGMGRAA
ncbi:hypothetical protein [Streptomyces sp. NPDC096132]|uniref:hypothetical protein n=1 Tax=Streptomyces sp. NPDC096132 TaxID=3366075 RepID=UPI0037F9B7C7